jgi:hypothetical protein
LFFRLPQVFIEISENLEPAPIEQLLADCIGFFYRAFLATGAEEIPAFVVACAVFVSETAGDRCEL